RREAQRAENQRRNAEKLAAAESVESTKLPLSTPVAKQDLPEVQAIDQTNDTIVVARNDESNDTTSAKRRRGRRGGRRRRRPEGESSEINSVAQEQSEFVLENSDASKDIVIEFTHADEKQPVVKNDSKPNPQQNAHRNQERASPVVVSVIPVSVAESDFSDLEKISTETKPIVEPQIAVSTPAVVEQTSTAPKTTAPLFVEPKPQQAGYVPVAPPSFSMPNSSNNSFDFTVHISPENKGD
ncbi:MAG TPA: hypothetical protein VN247_06735, partial [Arenimonas sp.]|nr:hypothetical protein [Arenimonas sp.]